jgi:light-regulated signal transduction histidine kinase (bacteriophytochrome)
MVGVCMDTTDRKIAEEGLRMANVELRRKNREMEEFVYTVSHDLKSPLVTHLRHRRHAPAQRRDRVDRGPRA